MACTPSRAQSEGLTVSEAFGLPRQPPPSLPGCPRFLLKPLLSSLLALAVGLPLTLRQEIDISYVCHRRGLAQRRSAGIRSQSNRDAVRSSTLPFKCFLKRHRTGRPAVEVPLCSSSCSALHGRTHMHLHDNTAFQLLRLILTLRRALLLEVASFSDTFRT